MVVVFEVYFVVAAVGFGVLDTSRRLPDASRCPLVYRTFRAGSARSVADCSRYPRVGSVRSGLYHPGPCFKHIEIVNNSREILIN